MRQILPIILTMLLASCSISETPDIGVVVSCNGIVADHPAPQRIHLLIDRTDPEITFLWSTGFTITVAYPYYQELNLVLCEGQTLTIGGTCVLE